MNKQTKRMLLRTKKQVFGDMLGNNSSRFHGEGFEFSELREYIYGDDIRKMDWKSTAKLGKPFVKVYREERELNVVVSTMLNGSTYFGTDKAKSEYICEVLAVLGFAAVRNGDMFAYYNFADKLYRHSKPSKKLYAVNSEVEYASEFDVLGKEGDFDSWTKTLYKRVKRKSLLFMISDFVGEVDLGLLAKKHDLFVIIIRDRFEENPTDLGYIRLIDTEDYSSYEGDVNGSAISAYKAALIENDAKLYAQFSRYGIRHLKLFTDEIPAGKIMREMR